MPHRNAEWENALGIDKSKGIVDESKPKKQETANDMVPSIVKPNGYTNGAATPQTMDAIRPKRAGKKRRYDDESFEGYGEGYDDDDGDSSDNSRRGSISSRQKRQRFGSIGVP